MFNRQLFSGQDKDKDTKPVMFQNTKIHNFEILLNTEYPMSNAEYRIATPQALSPKPYAPSPNTLL